MQTNQKHPNQFFDVENALAPDAPSYIERQVDADILAAIQRGKFCVVFAPHHMGKSSLMVHTIHALQAEKTCCISMSMAGGNDPDIDPEQLFLLLLRQLKAQTALSIDEREWWQSHADMPVATRLKHLWQSQVLPAIDGRCILFVDSVNADTHRVFVDGLLDAIAQVYAEKTSKSVWKNFSVVVLGQASLENWGRTAEDAPFANAVIHHLQEFSIAETEHFRAGLPDADNKTWDALLKRVNYWTAGHPYLTQRIFVDIERMWDAHWDTDRVDSVVDTIFLAYDFISDPNLQFVMDSIREAPEQKSLLSLYQKIYQDKAIPANTDPALQRQLAQIGLVKFDGDKATVRNNIYRTVFDQSWIKSYAQLNWRWATVLAVVFGVLFAGLILGFILQNQEKHASQAGQLIENMAQASAPEQQLANLAALLKLPEYQDRAHTLFFDDLSRDEAIALLTPANPTAMGDDLVTVI